jgi:hypothetical protein
MKMRKKQSPLGDIYGKSIRIQVNSYARCRFSIFISENSYYISIKYGMKRVYYKLSDLI